MSMDRSRDRGAADGGAWSGGSAAHRHTAASGTSSPPPQQLAVLLERAVRLREQTGSDAAVLEALQVVVDACRVELVAAQDAALAAADKAIRRLQLAQASGDVAAIRQARRGGAAAVAHAESVSARVIQALVDLQAAMVEVSGPSLQRMLRGVAVTEAVLTHAAAQMPLTSDG